MGVTLPQFLLTGSVRRAARDLREQALGQLEVRLGTSESLLGVQAYLQLHDMYISMYGQISSRRDSVPRVYSFVGVAAVALCGIMADF
jgi:hypothetical protein